MLRSYFLIFLSIASVALLPQCSNDSSSAMIGRSGRTSAWRDAAVVSPAAPSSAALQTARNKSRDRHGMPVYSFAERNRVVRTTAYTCSECDHIQYGSNNAVGTTLKYSSRARSAAADWSFYPLGTVFKINGHSQLYVIDDYGSALTGAGTIDIYHPSKSMMNAWGRRTVEINVLKWGSFEQSAAILSRRTSYGHCRQMYANIQRLRGSAPKKTVSR